MPETVSAEAVATVVNAANSVRADNGEPLIEGLPAGERQDSARCVLARAFNFDCHVDGFADDYSVNPALAGVWFAAFAPEHEPQAHALAEALGTGTIEGAPGYYSETVLIELPEPVARIAVAFDAGEFGETL